MIYLFIVVIFGGVGVFTQLRKMNSPAGFFYLYNYTSVAIFYVFQVGIFDELLKGNWHVENDFSGHEFVVAFLYLLLMVGSYIILLMVKAESGAARIDGGVLINDFSSIKNILRKEYVFLCNLIFISVMILIIVLHVATVDWGVLLLNFDFSETRNPLNLGFTDKSAIIHNLVKFFCLIASGLFIVALRFRWLLFCSVYFVSWMYFLLVMLGATSKWAAISIFLVSGLVVVLWRSGISKVIGIWLFVLGCYLYLMVVGIRVETEFGLIPIFDNIFSFGSGGNLIESLAVVLLSLFSGAFVVAESINQLPAYYPAMYKLLSFSPLLGSMDGFPEYMHYEYRAAFFKPYNVNAELLSFGVHYLLIYYSVFFLLLYRFQLFFYRSSAAISVPVYMFFMFIIMVMGLYPIRNVFRYQIMLFLWIFFYRVYRNERW